MNWLVLKLWRTGNSSISRIFVTAALCDWIFDHEEYIACNGEDIDGCCDYIDNNSDLGDSYQGFQENNIVLKIFIEKPGEFNVSSAEKILENL